MAMTTLLSGYQNSWLPRDIAAGVSVAAVALPIAIAFAHLAGVPPVYGLYASLLPLVAYALLGSSPQLIMAPDGATCAMVAAVVAPLAGPDPARYVTLTSALAIMAGVFCVAAGLGGLGFLTNFLAQPILTGYLNGIAIWIITGQIGTLFGLNLESAPFFRLIWLFLGKLSATHLPSLAVGLCTLAVLLLLPRFAPKAPGPLVAMVGGIACSAAFDFATHGIKMLGTIPAGLPVPALPSLSMGDWQSLVSGAAGLALISYASAMVTARGFATKNHYAIDSNREFIALGVADIGAGLLQGFAISGADSRTAMNDSVGGKTQVTGLVTALVLALTLMFLTVPLAGLPMPVLAAVLVKAALGLFDLKALATLWRVSRKEFLLCMITLLGVITVGVLQGVLVAIAVAIIMLVAKSSRPHDGVLGRLPGTDTYLDKAAHPEAEFIPGLVIYRFDAGLLFFNADHFKARALSAIRSATAPVRHLLVDAETIPLLDTTGAATLDELRGELERQGIGMSVTSATINVENMLNRSGFTARLGKERMYPAIEPAVQALCREGATKALPEMKGANR